MLRRFGLALLAIASLAGGARAQSVDVPKPYAIPLPPMSEPRWELGARYWWSDGKTSFNFTSSKIDPLLGNPTSKLTYDGTNGNSAEFVWRAKNESNTFAKGFVGGGWLNGGTLDDQDFLAGQVKFSDTSSKIGGNSLLYGTIDVGQDFTFLDRAMKVTFGPFVGFNFWQETATAFGARCNRDDVDGAVCGPPGFIAVPFSTKAIQNEPNWASLRLGGELRVKLWDRLSLIADAAALPVAYVWNEDSHFLRKDIGTVPKYRGPRHRLGLPTRGRSTLRLHAELVGRRGRALLARGGRPRQHRFRAFPNQGRAERLHQRALRRVRRRDL